MPDELNGVVLDYVGVVVVNLLIELFKEEFKCICCCVNNGLLVIAVIRCRNKVIFNIVVLEHIHDALSCLVGKVNGIKNFIELFNSSVIS